MDPNQLQRRAREASELLKALANARRLTILCQLLEGEKSVGELVRTIGLSQSALSQHLARLRRDAGEHAPLGADHLLCARGRRGAGAAQTLHALDCGRGRPSARAPSRGGSRRRTLGGGLRRARAPAVVERHRVPRLGEEQPTLERIPPRASSAASAQQPAACRAGSASSASRTARRSRARRPGGAASRMLAGDAEAHFARAGSWSRCAAGRACAPGPMAEAGRALGRAARARPHRRAASRRS